MLPNSRIPTTTTINTTTTTPPLKNNDNNNNKYPKHATTIFVPEKKGFFMSRFKSNDHPQKTLKYESKPIINTNITTTVNTTHHSGNSFSKLFKKKGSKPSTTLIIEPELSDNQPQIRPVKANHIDRHANIPLAPIPPVFRNSTSAQAIIPEPYSMRQQPPSTISTTPPYTPLPALATQLVQPKQFQHQQQVAPMSQVTPPPTLPRHSSSINTQPTLRKSTGSYSVYSTFGGSESHDSVEEDEVEISPVQHDINTPSDDDSSDDSEEFVDATGVSQEDIEREEALRKKRLSKLSNRLSGEHFSGSVGSLLASMQPVTASTATADDELTESMLNWKRHSDSSSKRWMNKRMSTSNSSLASNGSTNKRYSTLMDKRLSSKSSIVTAIDLTATTLPHSSTGTTLKPPPPPPIPSAPTPPLRQITRKKSAVSLSVQPAVNPTPKSQQEKEAKSMTLCQETEQLLIARKPVPLTRIQQEDLKRVQDISAEFSKTLDTVWNASTADNENLFSLDEAIIQPFKLIVSQADTTDQEDQVNDELETGDGEEEDDSVKQTALSLWFTSNNNIHGNDKSSKVVVSKEEMASWLGQKDPFHQAVLYEYLQFFDFQQMRLDSAFRKLCSKLYFKAEAQQIDRILEAFAQRYWDCNKSTLQASLFKSADIVYAVVYSLLLLNTDLHVAQGNHVRMTRSEFIRNTMSTVRDQREQQQQEIDQEFRTIVEKNNRHTMLEMRQWETELEAHLKEMYVSVKHHQILQPLNGSTSTYNNSSSNVNKRTSILYSNRNKVLGLKRSVNSMIRKSGRESMLMFEQLEQQQAMPTISHHSQLMRSSTSTPSSSVSIMRKDSFSSVSSGTASSFSSRCGGTAANASIPQHQQMNHLRLKDLPPSYQHGAVSPPPSSNTSSSEWPMSTEPPFYKQGIVIRKHLLENASQKARHREWRECFLEVTEGELRMYALHQHQGSQQLPMNEKHMFRHSTATIPSLYSQPESVRSMHGSSTSSNRKLLSSGSSMNGSIHSNYSSSGFYKSSTSINSNPISHRPAPQQLICKIPLNHTLSNPLPPPGYNRHRPHVFATQQPDGGVYLFQVASEQDAHAWVSTCNYWAARKSKTPLRIVGGGRMEYGWSEHCLHDVIMDLDNVGDQTCNYFNYLERDPDSITISAWHPPESLSQLPSELDEMEQLDSLQTYLNELNRDINEHRDIKPKMMIKFPNKCQNYNKVIRNWEAKSKYLLHEIIKYQNYCDALEKSIQMKEEAAATAGELAAMATTDLEEAADDCIENNDSQPQPNTHTTNTTTTTSLKDTLKFQSTSVDLFKEINKELSIHLF